MKKLVALLIVCLCGVVCLHAQDELSVKYKGKGRKFQDSKKTYTVDYILDIDGSRSHFYSSLHERQEDIADSMYQLGSNAYDVISEYKKRNLWATRTSYNVFKNYPEQGELVFSETLLNKFRYKEPMPKIDWKLEETDSIIAGYTCFRATAEYRGRKWTAFYTFDVPVSDGPWKLCGLPGLILYARDAKNDFSFECVGIEKGCKRPIEERKAKYTSCTAKEMCELKKLEAENDTEFKYRVLGMRPRKFDANGRPMKDIPRKACLMEIIK